MYVLYMEPMAYSGWQGCQILWSDVAVPSRPVCRRYHGSSSWVRDKQRLEAGGWRRPRGQRWAWGGWGCGRLYGFTVDSLLNVVGVVFQNRHWCCIWEQRHTSSSSVSPYHYISSEEKSQQKFPAPLSARSACNVLQRTGLKTNLCRNNCSLQIMGGNWLKAHFRSHKTLYKVHMLYTI